MAMSSQKPLSIVDFYLQARDIEPEVEPTQETEEGYEEEEKEHNYLYVGSHKNMAWKVHLYEGIEETEGMLSERIFVQFKSPFQHLLPKPGAEYLFGPRWESHRVARHPKFTTNSLEGVVWNREFNAKVRRMLQKATYSWRKDQKDIALMVYEGLISEIEGQLKEYFRVMSKHLINRREDVGSY